jgi:hypothetical protein
MMYKTLDKKLEYEQHEPRKIPGWTDVPRKDKQFLLC